MTYLRISLFFFFVSCSQFVFSQSPQTTSSRMIGNTSRDTSICDSSTMFAGTSEQALVLGSQSNDVQFLCYGDSLNILHNGNQILDSDPVPFTEPGISYVFYRCQPYISGDDILDVEIDSCVLHSGNTSPGFFLDGIVDSLGNGTFFNQGMLQNFFNNGDVLELWFAPITIHDHNDLSFESNILSPSGGCVNVNTDDAFRVVYLNAIEILPLSGNTLLIEGGLPEFDNSQYEISIVLQDDISVTGTISNSSTSHGDTLSISVPQDGVYIINIEDGKSCGFTASYILSASGSFTSLDGFVYWDLIENCSEDALDVPFHNWMVEFINLSSGEVHYSSTDSLGRYSSALNSLDYDVRLIPYNELWESCPEVQSISAVLGQNTTLNPFLTSGINACPQLEVNMGIIATTRCFDESYHINYCNSGTISAQNSYIEVTLDERVTVNNSSIPWSSQNGNTYTFDVGTISIFECHAFDIDITVDCDVPLGEVLCSQAIIFSDDTCLPSSNDWDMSSIDVGGICVVDDFIIFTINNTGQDMDNSRQWRLYSNDTLVEQGTFQLSADESFPHTVITNGNTFRFEADQHPSFPGNSHPYAVVEGCGADENGNSTTGFVNIFPEDDTELFISTSCSEVVGSFDPNDKLAFPVGYGQEHFIEASTDLEYVIRFQNTGTAPAVNIVIKDTLSEFLNPTTIQLGTSSHPYEFSISGTGVLTFAFNNIMLPDSTTNLEASQGFISFKINQKPNNPIGSIIENKASIYFDFNEPIVTNTTFHTIGEDFIAENLTTSTSNITNNNSVEIYPNPFNEVTFFNIKENYTNGRLIIYDVTGKVVREHNVQGQSFTLEKEDLSTGIYYYQLYSEQVQIGTGKLMIQ